MAFLRTPLTPARPGGDGGCSAERANEVIILSLPSSVRAHAEALLQAFCDRRVPESVRREVRLEAAFRGDIATIFEHRPPYVSSFLPAREGDEWTRLAIAQFRYDAETRLWTLFCADRSSRWHKYAEVDPSERLEDLIEEVDADPTGIFWG